jgi:3-hydroxyisobutyrate dehydrogenase-like beta-hydroxyacid dehydrogenase
MTAPFTIGLLHPGEMGAAVGRCLTGSGHKVLWASDGRSGQTAARAAAAGLTDAGTAKAIAERAAVIISVCPPHAAIDVARSVAGFGGLYLDANAVSPQTAHQVSQIITAAGASYVDGGIIGPPPQRPGSTRLYLSGVAADEVRALFVGTPLEARAAGAGPWSASAVKMAYASWTKGSAALLLAARELAAAEGVRDALDAEWELSQPGLSARHHGAEVSAASKGWRWTAEMTEIATTMGAAGLPEGFHKAAAEMFGRFPRRSSSAKLTGPSSNMRSPRAS